MRRSDINEAAAILRRLLDALIQTASTDVDDIAAADFRQAVGNLNANAENAIAGGTFGQSLAECFRAGREAGATFNELDAVRLTALDEDPVSTPAVIVVSAYIQQALVAMSRIIADQEFRSRDQVEDWRTRLSSAFDLAEEDAANERDSASYQILLALHAAAIRDLTARARPLPRMINFNLSTRYPALWIANRLYGDGSRFDDIIAENRVVHPLFVPAEGRALSR